MGITVSDIERKEFAYKGAGYDPYDVDQYLDQICDEMVAMQDRIAQLEKELDEAYREVEKAKHAAQPVQAEPFAPPPVVEHAPIAKTSETLESILLNAQRLADDAVENASRKAEEALGKAKLEAEQMIGKAKLEAEEMVGKAKLEAEEATESALAKKERMEAEYAQLKEKAETFKAAFLRILDEHKSLFNKQMKETKDI